MNGFAKIVVLIAVAVYIISPIDLVPGPVDDIIVLLLTIAANKRLKSDE
jgi:uncharacterized membrane protein YkvA (DUF1232 family)